MWPAKTTSFRRWVLGAVFVLQQLSPVLLLRAFTPVSAEGGLRPAVYGGLRGGRGLPPCQPRSRGSRMPRTPRSRVNAADRSCQPTNNRHGGLPRPGVNAGPITRLRRETAVNGRPNHHGTKPAKETTHAGTGTVLVLRSTPAPPLSWRSSSKSGNDSGPHSGQMS